MKEKFGFHVRNWAPCLICILKCSPDKGRKGKHNWNGNDFECWNQTIPGIAAILGTANVATPFTQLMTVTGCLTGRVFLFFPVLTEAHNLAAILCWKEVESVLLFQIVLIKLHLLK